MAIVFVGVDLAKNLLAVQAINDAGRAQPVRPAVARGKRLALFAALPPRIVGEPACHGAHHWAREFEALGRRVKPMAPEFVAPCRMSGKRGKNDAADAVATCETRRRPHMRFVPPGRLDRRGRLTVHRARRGFVEQRKATLSRITAGAHHRGRRCATALAADHGRALGARRGRARR